MVKRHDSSGYFYHWTKADISHGNIQAWYESAYRKLLKILSEFELRSGASLGLPNGHNCICFTESPLSYITNDTSKYQPFGLEFSKRNIYILGGAHVIYGSQSDFLLLPEELKWRFMIHEPLLRDDKRIYGIDFTWEREVRVNSDKIDLIGESLITGPSYSGNVDLAFNSIVLPNASYKDRLFHELKITYVQSAQRNARDEREYDWLISFYDDVLEQYSYQIKIL